MKSVLTLLVLFATVCLLQAEDKKPAAKDESKLVGTWQLVSGERGGEPAPDKFVEGFRLIFKAEGKVTATSKGKDQEGSFKLDATKKPKHIELTIDGKTVEGIYELSDDGLKLCLADGTRPTEFKSPQGSKAMLMVLKREKK